MLVANGPGRGAQRPFCDIRMQAEHGLHGSLADALVLQIGIDPDPAYLKMTVVQIEEDQTADDSPVQQDLVIGRVLDPLEVPIL